MPNKILLDESIDGVQVRLIAMLQGGYDLTHTHSCDLEVLYLSEYEAISVSLAVMRDLLGSDHLAIRELRKALEERQFERRV
jgi:hypothetical protein